MINFKSSKELAKVIESTNLNNNAKKEDIDQLINDAIKYNFYSIVVSPYYVSYAKNKLKNTNIKVGTVVGFPLGHHEIPIKLNEAINSIANGADELDMVINISAIKAGDYDTVKEEIEQIVNISKNNEDKNVIIKTILETGLLNKREIEEVSKIASDAGTDFIKTSTGFNNVTGAKATDIRRIKRIVPNTKIKASGGIKDYKTAFRLLSAGADHIGTSSGAKIIEEFQKISENYNNHKEKTGLI
ncbi:MAG: deoxyribose-phosphate aldolase [Methanobrevibacter sp.]|jgi:deoxyribose-phosphate aldolase|nr:deoxyribose-phosphate aldolase [Candidatus Methanoflexus mossambicus]